MRLTLGGVGPSSQAVAIEVDGAVVLASPGDTVAAAMIDSGLRVCRDAGEGDGRGFYCGMGACNECVMVIDGQPGRLTCMTKVSPGMIVERQPQRPRPTAASPAPDSTVRELTPEVLIIGGGPAGLAAAAMLAEVGVDVLVIDERARVGGQFFKQPATERVADAGALDHQFQTGRRLEQRARQAGVEILTGAVVWGVFEPHLLYATHAGGSLVLRPKQLVIATGATERAIPIPGWTLPGVMTTGAAQTLVRGSQVSPGNKVLMAGNGPLNLQVAAELAQAGVPVAALIEQADLRWWRNLAAGATMLGASPGLVRKGLSYRLTLQRRAVPVIDRSVVVRIEGSSSVEGVVVAGIGADGTPVPGSERAFEVDAVCLGSGFVPANEVARALGCRHRYDVDRGYLVTEVTEDGRTSLPTVWALGDGVTIAGAYVAVERGERVGRSILAGLGRVASGREQSGRRTLARHLRFQRALSSLYASHLLSAELADDTTVICRCETVALEAVRSQLESGVQDVGSVKRVSRAGMGKCQARYCGPVLLALAAQSRSGPLDEYSGFAPQPPVRPTRIADMALSLASDVPQQRTEQPDDQ